MACVASVSVGLSAGLKNFSLFERAKIGASAKNVALAPIFAPPKSEKCLERAGKPTETLATRAMSKKEHVPEKKWKYLFVLLAVRKRGKCGNAFKVTNDREQLGRLQTKLGPLWSFNAKSTV